MMRITVLGSTGSIGVNTLDVIARNAEHYEIVALTANTQAAKLFEQCCQFKPRYAVMVDSRAAAQLRIQLSEANVATEVLAGEADVIAAAELTEIDCVVAGIVGAKGLLPTLAAIKAGKRVLLANKEPMVMAGAIFKQALAESAAELLPVDSEHNAVFQCSGADALNRAAIRKITLTASGGPFCTTPLDQFDAITPEQACAHPKWKMGKKISVDSATMMNKGLEIIEAYWLFDVAAENIDVILHPQSTVHALVEYYDGSVLAHLGNPDMRIPIAHALGWPKRIQSGAGFLDLLAIGKLEFESLCLKRYPCLALAQAALKAGGTAGAILNAANETAVDAFLQGRIRFTDIARVNAHIQEQLLPNPYHDLDTVLEADANARRLAEAFICSSGS